MEIKLRFPRAKRRAKYSRILAVLLIGLGLGLTACDGEAEKVTAVSPSPASGKTATPSTGQTQPTITNPVSIVTSLPGPSPTLGSSKETPAALTVSPAPPATAAVGSGQPVVLPTAGKLKDGKCSFEGVPNGLRPEHLEALQPQYRQPDKLPAAPTLYELDVTVNPTANTYTGQATISFWNRSPQPMPNLMLRTYPDFFSAVGGQLNVKELKLNGKPVTPRDKARTFVEGQIAEPIAPCSPAQLTLKFEGKIPSQLREDLYAVGTFYAGQGAFALATFYPQLALWEQGAGKPGWDWTVTPLRASSDLTAAESSFYDVRIQAPARYQLIGSGVSPKSEQPAESNANKAWRFVGGPFREFAVVGSENFLPDPLNRPTTQGNVSVKVYTLKNTDPNALLRQQDFATKALDATIATLDDFGQLVAPYPFVQYNLVEFPIIGFNGMEWPMFSQFSINIFTRTYVANTEEQKFDNLFYSKPGTLVIVHEVLHQWWYNIVGNDQQAEPFIDEGLTEYCTYLLPELTARRANTSPEAARTFAKSWLDKLRLRIRQQDLPAFGDLKVNSPAIDVSLEQAGLAYYRKAPLFYEAYRTKFGDDTFFKFLKSYYQNNQYKLVHYTDLQKELEAAVPTERQSEAVEFIKRWLNEKKLVNDLGNS